MLITKMYFDVTLLLLTLTIVSVNSECPNQGKEHMLIVYSLCSASLPLNFSVEPIWSLKPNDNIFSDTIEWLPNY
jgi:hypothetical protein